MLHSLIHRLHSPDAGAFFIRLALGLVFINAGWMKITGMEGTVGFFAMMNFPAWTAYFVAYAEFIGGILLLLGLFTRYVGIVLAVIMLVATKIHFAKGFSLANGGYEYVLVLFLASLALVTMGSGKYSLAHLIKHKEGKK